MNSAANYVLALRFKQLDNSFQHIAGEIDDLKSGIAGQGQHVEALVQSVDEIQSNMRRQNDRVAELEQEVKNQMQVSDEKLRHYEALSVIGPAARCSVIVPQCRLCSLRYGHWC